jgi:parvulin-like peptidyl-prolyl isomerase
MRRGEKKMRGNMPLRVLTIFFGLPVITTLAESSPIFATVDGTEITRQQFELEVYKQARQTFYHGRPSSEAEFLKFRKGVADELVDRALLLNEARRRSITPDHADIAVRLAAYEERFAGTERWQSDGERMLAGLRDRLEEDSILNRLEGEIRAIGMPEEAELRDFYEANPDKFTEPEQIRVSVILLAVAPSFEPAAWQAAQRLGNDLAEQIRGGADFAELARMHSGDPSSGNGGDMGYLHAGMLSEAAQDALDELAVGELSEPVVVLEGVAIFRLTGRRTARLQEFEVVRSRAAELWQREEGHGVWAKTIADLRARGNIMIDDDYLRSLPVSRQ